MRDAASLGAGEARATEYLDYSPSTFYIEFPDYFLDDDYATHDPEMSVHRLSNRDSPTSRALDSK